MMSKEEAETLARLMRENRDMIHAIKLLQRHVAEYSLRKDEMDLAAFWATVAGFCGHYPFLNAGYVPLQDF